MKLRLKSPFSAAIAISFGMVVLLGYFFGVDAVGEPTTLGILRNYILRGAVVLSATALIVGIINLASVHLVKIKDGKTVILSSLLLTTLCLTTLIGIYEMVGMDVEGGSKFHLTQWIFDHIQLPVQTSLMAVVCISLTYTASRLISKKMTVFSVIFISTFFILLLGAIPQLSTRLPILAEIRAWIIQVPAVGGARGILLGVALGSVATGIKVLMGIDRPYQS